MSEYEGPDRRTPIPEHWHISKSFSVGHILTTIGLVAGFAVYVINFNQRVSNTEKETEFNRLLINQEKESRASDKKEFNTAIDKVGTQVTEINRKLDRLIERNLSK